MASGTTEGEPHCSFAPGEAVRVERSELAGLQQGNAEAQVLSVVARSGLTGGHERLVVLRRANDEVPASSRRSHSVVMGVRVRTLIFERLGAVGQTSVVVERAVVSALISTCTCRVVSYARYVDVVLALLLS